MQAPTDSGAGPSVAAAMGPYWRRKTGTTLPGELTAQQLRRANILRQAMGLAPAGGKVGLNQGLEQGDVVKNLLQGLHPVNPPGGNVAGQDQAALAEQYRHVLAGLHEQPVDPGFYIDDMQSPAGAVSNVRDALLARLQGQAHGAAGTSIAALRHVIGHQQPAAGRILERRPILPPRKVLAPRGQPLAY